VTSISNQSPGRVFIVAASVGEVSTPGCVFHVTPLLPSPSTKSALRRDIVRFRLSGA
jgi:hypothetical protein